MLEVLKTDGYTVLEAHNGTEALAIVEQNPGPIALLLTDVVMPGMSGRELAERLSAVQPSMKGVYVGPYGKRDCGKRDAAPGSVGGGS